MELSELLNRIGASGGPSVKVKLTPAEAKQFHEEQRCTLSLDVKISDTKTIKLPAVVRVFTS